MISRELKEEAFVKGIKLTEKHAVKSIIHKAHDIVFAEVEDNAVIYHVTVDNKNIEDSVCTCELCKKGIICEHIMATIFTVEMEHEAYEKNNVDKHEFFDPDLDDDDDDLYQPYYVNKIVEDFLQAMSKEEIIDLIMEEVDYNQLPSIKRHINEVKYQYLDVDPTNNITASIEQFNYRVYKAAEEIHTSIVTSESDKLSEEDKNLMTWVIMQGTDEQIEDLKNVFLDKFVFGHPILVEAFRILYTVLNEDEKKLIKKYIEEKIKSPDVYSVNFYEARGNLLIMEHIILEFKGNLTLHKDVEIMLKYAESEPFIDYMFSFYRYHIIELIEEIKYQLKNQKVNIRALEYLYNIMYSYTDDPELKNEIYYIETLIVGASTALNKLRKLPNFNEYLKRIQESDIKPSNLMSVYKALDMKEDLFNLVMKTKNVKDLIRYTIYLKDDYNKELVDLYYSLFEKKAEKAKTGGDYKETCRMLKGLLKCDDGKKYCQDLYEIIKEKYPRKIGLLDEMLKYINK